jgi:hypothetical protein
MIHVSVDQQAAPCHRESCCLLDAVLPPGIQVVPAMTYTPLGMCRYIMQTYARPNLVFTRGEGVRLYDAHGKEYLDFAAGIAVNALGTDMSAADNATTVPLAACVLTCRAQVDQRKPHTDMDWLWRQ